MEHDPVPFQSGRLARDRRAAELGKSIDFSLTTNATLLRPEDQVRKAGSVANGAPSR